MSVDKIILRAFFTTLASIAILFLFMLTTLVCVYPQTMMKITYNLGMEKASIWFAEISYDRSDDIYYIAYATEVAIGQQDYAKINDCGETLIKADGFTDFCVYKDETSATVELAYKEYLYGQVCIAKYERALAAESSTAEAVDRAFALTENAFPENNAVVAVLITALQREDAPTVQTIREKMLNMQENGYEDDAYFQAILALTESK